MKLYSPKFEAALKKSVETAVQTNPAFKAEFLRIKCHSLNIHNAWLSNLIIPIFLFFLLLLTWDRARELDLCLLVINLWLVISVMFFGLYFKTIPRTSKESKIFPYYPVGLENIYIWERDKALKASLINFYSCLVGFGVIAYLFDFTAFQWLSMVVVSIIAWLGCLCLSIISARYIPAGFSLFLTVATFIVGCSQMCEIAALEHHPLIANYKDLPLEQLNLFLPTGWLVSLVHTCLNDSEAMRGLMVIPLFLGFFALDIGGCLKRFREPLRYSEPVMENVIAPFDLIPGTEVLHSRFKVGRGVQLEEHTIEEGILSGEFMKRTNWEFGLGRLAWGWFSDRQKTLADFAFSRPPRMLIVWRFVLSFALLFSCLSILTLHFSLEFSQGLFKMGVMLSAFILLVSLSHTGFMFHFKNFGNSSMPYHAFFPIDFANSSRMFLKFNAIQMPLFTVYACASMLCVSFSIRFGYLEAILMFIQAHAYMFLVTCSFISLANLYSYTFVFSFRTFPTVMMVSLICCFIMATLTFLPIYAFSTPDQLILQVLSPIYTFACACFFLWRVSKLPQNTKLDMIRPAYPKGELSAKHLAINAKR